MSRKQPTLPMENTGTDPLSNFTLYALLFTWFEADIIEATVKNLFAQGVERVFVIDNDSPDNTREVAETAGAEVVSIYRSNNFNEAMKVMKVNEITRQIVADAAHDHVWVLHVDADELPTGPHGKTVRQYLETLDSEFRIVGSTWIQHRPTMTIHNIPGFHPAEFQLHSRYQGGEGVCTLGHNKHQLIRYDKGGVEIKTGPGYHWYDSLVLQKEPVDTLWAHHFNFREFDVTQCRLKTLVETRMAQRNAFAKRRSGSDDAECFWTTRYKKMDTNYVASSSDRVWPELVNTVDIPKWYTQDDLLQAVLERFGRARAMQFLAERAFLLGDAEEALGHIDAYPFGSQDTDVENSLKIKRIKCLAFLDRKVEARDLVLTMLQEGPSVQVVRELKLVLQ